MNFFKSHKLLVSLLLFLSISTQSQNFRHLGELCEDDYGYSKKELQLFDDFFEYKADLLSFLEIKNGEWVAEVGSAEGYNLGVLSLLYDSVTFYAEDIGLKYLSQKKLNKNVKRYSKLRKSPQTNNFHFVIGDFKKTNLPEAKFDKIIMIASFHEFTFVSEMIKDMATKLKPNGKLILMEAFSIGKDLIYCEDHHCGKFIDSTCIQMSKEGFYLTKMRSPETHIINYINCLVFEKDQKKSDDFFAKQKAVKPYVKMTLTLDSLNIANDSVAVRIIADTLLRHKEDLVHVYTNYQGFLKDIALKWVGTWNPTFNAREYQASINILSINKLLFPSSFQNEYYLGVINEDKGNINNAKQHYKNALKLNNNSKQCLKKLKQHDRSFSIAVLSF